MWTTVVLIFKNLGAIIELFNSMKKTPIEQHDELLESLKKEADSFAKKGRPTWD